MHQTVEQIVEIPVPVVQEQASSGARGGFIHQEPKTHVGASENRGSGFRDRV